MEDIATRHDIDLIMSEFYRKLLADPSISYIFTDVAKIDLDEHLPKIADFWEQNVLQAGKYKNNVLKVHLDLNALTPLTNEHFQTWLSHLERTINSNFSGQNAERMKTNAVSIATVMKMKMRNRH